MRTFLLAFASVTVIAIVYADWAGCPEGTKFDGYLKDSQQLNSLTEGCHNGRVRSNFQYVEGRLPYPVCCAPIGRGRRAAFGKEADSLHEKAPQTNGTW